MAREQAGPMFIPLPQIASFTEPLPQVGYLTAPAGLQPPPGLDIPLGTFPGDLLMAYAREASASNFSFFSESDVALPRKITDDSEAFTNRVVVETPETPTSPAFPMPAEDDDAAGMWGLPKCVDNAAIEAILEPVLQDILDRSMGKLASKEGNHVRWWTQPQSPILCPLTCFPICLLPYPPFKLRANPKQSSPHRLVDGKFLAMQCIITGHFVACGRVLQASDIGALDDYVHRCKLGQYRPGRAVALANEASNAVTPEQRAKASQELDRLIASAQAELGKLRRIQENRFLQIKKDLPAHAQAALKNCSPSSSSANGSVSCRSRLTSMGSMSTRASVSSGESDTSFDA